MAAGGFWTGIALATGSEARRRLAAPKPSESERLQQLAQRQRNLRAYQQRYLEDPQRAAQLIGEINTIIRDMPNAQAAAQLAELAREYRRLGRRDLVEATLVELVERFPDEPGNWAYFTFGHHAPPYAAAVAKAPVQACNACHEANAAQDYVFTQFYPVLRDARPGS